MFKIKNQGRGNKKGWPSSRTNRKLCCVVFLSTSRNVGLFGICSFAINRPKKISLPIINSLLSKAHHFLSSLVSAKSGKSALNHDDCAFCAPRAAGLLHKSFVNYVTKIRSNKGTKLCLVHTINFYFAITIFSLAHII